MVDKSDEYTSLRQELLDHQSSRSTILGLTLTVTTALFGVGVQMSNPLVPLFALLLLFLARIQVTQTHSAVQRIASYIRIMLEKDNDELNWETGSYRIRRASIEKTGKIAQISPLIPIDNFLLACSVLAILLAVFITWIGPQSAPLAQSGLLWPQGAYFILIGITTIVWGAMWLWHYRKIRKLERMELDDSEAAFWKDFKQNAAKIKESE